MGGVILGAQKLEIVGRDQGDVQFLVQPQEAVVDLFFDVDPVALDLEDVVVTENGAEFFGRRFGRRQSFALDQVSDLATDASRKTDQPL